MKNIVKFLGVFSAVSTCASTIAYADVASEFCKSLNGQVQEYYFKDQTLARHEVEFCWVGDGAVGTWTLYNFFHPSAESGRTVEGLLEFKKDNNLTKNALNAFFMNLRGDEIEAPKEGEEASEEIKSDPLPNPAAKKADTNTLGGASGAPQPKLPVQLDPVIRNPSFVYCEQAGGRPFPLERANVDRSGVISTERSENPHAAVCFWENSAIEIWTLYWGSAHSRTESLAETLIWRE